MWVYTLSATHKYGKGVRTWFKYILFIFWCYPGQSNTQCPNLQSLSQSRYDQNDAQPLHDTHLYSCLCKDRKYSQFIINLKVQSCTLATLCKQVTQQTHLAGVGPAVSQLQRCQQILESEEKSMICSPHLPAPSKHNHMGLKDSVYQ